MKTYKVLPGQMSLFDIKVDVHISKEESSKIEEASSNRVNEAEKKNLIQEKVLSQINFYGKGKNKEKTEELISQISFSGFEEENRRKIQDVLDSNRSLCKVVYNGIIVYPSHKLIKEFGRMKKSGKLENMSNDMYEFLSLYLDIAHYNKHCYIQYYDNSFKKWYNECLVNARIPRRCSDVYYILQESKLI